MHALIASDCIYGSDKKVVRRTPFLLIRPTSPDKVSGANLSNLPISLFYPFNGSCELVSDRYRFSCHPVKLTRGEYRLIYFICHAFARVY